MAAAITWTKGVTTKRTGNSDCVQFGCGLSCPDGWLNFDSSPRLRLQRLPFIGSRVFGSRVVSGPFGRFPVGVHVGDIVHGLPVNDGGVRLLYCSHVLEHLSLGDLRRALANCHRMLRPGGVFRLVLPDLEFLISEYVRSTSPSRAETFIRSTLMGIEQRDRSVRGLLECFLGNSRHLWLWDYSGLAHELASIGFQRIRRASLGDSPHSEFANVEAPARWRDALGIEAAR
jgi:SAM-dependent methyltransferase